MFLAWDCAFRVNKYVQRQLCQRPFSETLSRGTDGLSVQEVFPDHDALTEAVLEGEERKAARLACVDLAKLPTNSSASRPVDKEMKES